MSVSKTSEAANAAVSTEAMAVSVNDGRSSHTTQQELLQAYIQLQERYRRCTDALGAARR